MRLLEFAVKGMQGLSSPLVRVQLVPGLNAVVVGDPTTRQALLDILYFALYPDPSRAEATTPLASGPDAAVSISVEGSGGEVYRLIRDLSSGAVSLSRRGTSSDAFELLTSTSTEVAQFLRVQEGMPDEVGFERVYMLGPDSFPSLKAGVRCRSGRPFGAGSAPFAPAAPGLPNLPSGMAPLPSGGPPPPTPHPRVFFYAAPPTPPHAPYKPPVIQGKPALAGRDAVPNEDWSPMLTEEKVALHRQLGTMVEEAKAAAAARAKRDELQLKHDALEEPVQEIARIDKQLAWIEQHKADDGMPTDMAERLDDLEEAEEKFNIEVKRLSHERLGADEAWSKFRFTPLQSDRMFIASTGFAVAAIVLAVALRRPWIALLNLPAALVAVGSSLRYVADLEKRARMKHRLEVVVEREQRLDRQHALETGVTKKLLEKLDLTEGEVRQKLAGRSKEAAERDTLVTRRATVHQQVGGDKGLEDFAKLALALDAASAEVAKLDKVGTADIDAMQARLQSLQAELEHHGAKDEPAAHPGFEMPDEAATVVEMDDDEEGYGSGYGVGGPSDGGGSGKLGLAGGYFASSGSFPLSGGLGGGLGGYGGGGGGSTPADRSRELVESAVDVLHTPLEGIVQALPARLSQYVSALTDGVYTVATLDHHGALSVAPSPTAPSVPYPTLEAPLVDLVDTALRLTLMEACVSRVPAPVLIDDPFTHFDSRRRTMFRQMLGYLGAATQTIVLTSLEDLDVPTQRID